MLIDRMQRRRFEMKYLINETKALQVRDFVQSYLDIDDYSAGCPNLSYSVHSLYLDSDDLLTYWETINGDRNRFKLRLRYYSVAEDTPVFFEIKRRQNNWIMKQRGGVKQSAVEHLLSGHLPEPDHLLAHTNKAVEALRRFCEMAHRIQAKPRVHIAYEREAYENSDSTVRVTMDRMVRCEPNRSYSIKTEMTDPKFSYRPNVILELKFTDRFPNWFGELVRIFNVMQRGAAKYVSSLQAIRYAGLVGARANIVQEEDAQNDD
jgi:SPX domain protein involved in polyphosphate accumulation